MGERGWAQRLLSWSWAGARVESAEVSRAKYFVRARARRSAWVSSRRGARRGATV